MEKKNTQQEGKKWWKIKPVSQPLRSVFQVHNMHTMHDAFK